MAATVGALAGSQAADLRTALEQGPLTILALGPLNNIAALLREHPELRRNVARLVAVMGRRPGHIFHPAEGAGGAMLFGHGPVFRDFNFALDPRAAGQVLAMNLPLSLVPYDAARGIEISAADLDRLEASLPWIIERSRGWLGYWRNDIGRAGFYPFDLIAAAYVAEPSLLRCVAVRAWVGEDDTLFLPWSGGTRRRDRTGSAAETRRPARRHGSSRADYFGAESVHPWWAALPSAAQSWEEAC